MVGEGVHPTLLIRLRVAAGARIHIARRGKRDTVYRAMFEGWVSGYPPRAVRHPRRTDVPKALPHGKRVQRSASPPLPISMRLAMRFHMRLLTLHFGTLSKPRYLQHMVRGAVAVWFAWLVSMMTARLLLPVLVVVLCIVSASPLTDLALVAVAFVLTTVAAAVTALVLGSITRQRQQFPTTPMYLGLLGVIPYLTLIALIARAEHGIVLALAAITAVAARPYLWRFVRRAWAAGSMLSA